MRDISSGGIAFEYISIAELTPESMISIIITCDRISFYLPDIPCKIVYVTNINTGNPSCAESRLRRCGLQYATLDIRMKEKLSLLLCNEVTMHFV